MSSKIILITGSNTGIGFELVRLLAEKGHIVYLTARNSLAGKEAQLKLKNEFGLDVEFLHMDVTDLKSIIAAKKAVEEAKGRLDILVNNAAISCIEHDQSAATVSNDTMRTIFDTNFFGLVQTTTTFIPLLRTSSQPTIVNVTSALGSNTCQSDPKRYFAYSPYSATKAAVNSYTISLAQELRQEGIKVNCVTPPYTATQLNRFGGEKTATEGAEAVLPWVLLDKDGPTCQFGAPGGTYPW